MIMVFYSNKRPEDAAFLDELNHVADAEANVTVVPTMTEPENPGMAGPVKPGKSMQRCWPGISRT
ncbi:hypothetical protein [Arthrobacter psychrochitiniphilus]|uniref:hypothetical protein n=1 Tax=Arthrobacter psychrochitiniphilus TaxID=291045 RepID=UPI003F7C3242